MSLTDEQIEKGKIAAMFKNKSNKFLKNQHARKIRRNMKNLDYVPQYNRFKGGWEFILIIFLFSSCGVIKYTPFHDCSKFVPACQHPKGVLQHSISH